MKKLGIAPTLSGNEYKFMQTMAQREALRRRFFCFKLKKVAFTYKTNITTRRYKHCGKIQF